MRYLLLIFTVCLIALSGGLGLLIAAPDDSIEGFDPHHPATLLPIAAAGFWECHSLVREWVDTTLGELRDVLQRKHLIESLPR
jgi:hypothetical protein